MKPSQWTETEHPKWCEVRHAVEFVSARYRPIGGRYFDRYDGTVKFRGNRRMFLVADLIDHFAREELEMTDVAADHEALVRNGRKGGRPASVARREANAK
ncbi:hypothetical protein GS634_07830 [Ruegeria atlantica]|uniref:Uncharacterized protein n=1 Tax=Ruegeria atlantica TaxID=81569 RepID=A0AA90YVU8_9RHOB|nr:hypothetical protein [Ruegeria atlantica]NOE18033.1 hypothetical protein [Ruegeria atlantica]